MFPNLGDVHTAIPTTMRILADLVDHIVHSSFVGGYESSPGAQDFDPYHISLLLNGYHNGPDKLLFQGETKRSEPGVARITMPSKDR